MQPLFVGVFSVAFLGERPTPRQWTGIALAVAGATLIGWGDLRLTGQALLGDGLALLGAALGAGYFVLGRRLRVDLGLWEYVAVVYGAAAVLLVAAALVTPAVPLTGFPAGDWWVFVALAAGPMMLGHTGLNYAVRYYPAYLVNLALLGEPVGATLLALVIPAIAETPPPNAVLGGIVILVGIGVGLLPGRGQR
jgi:drug/metabolite transporter (DMT)-like permease